MSDHEAVLEGVMILAIYIVGIVLAGFLIGWGLSLGLGLGILFLQFCWEFWKLRNKK